MTFAEFVDQVLPWLGVLLGGGGLAGWYITTRKLKPDIRLTDATTIEKMDQTISRLVVQVDKLMTDRDADQGRIDELETEIDDLYTGIRKLVQQLVDNNISPVWMPQKRRGRANGPTEATPKT